MEYVPVSFHTMVCLAVCSLFCSSGGIRMSVSCLSWHANGSSRSSRQCCPNAALRVDSVFSNDASCVAIHKSSA